MLKSLALILIILAIIGIVLGYVFAIVQIKIVAEPGGYIDASIALLLLAIATMAYDYIYSQQSESNEPIESDEPSEPSE